MEWENKMPQKKSLDLKGVISPLDLLKSKSSLASMEKGDILEVILADEDVAEDLITIIKRSSDEILYHRKGKDGIFISIRRGTGRVEKSDPGNEEL